MAEPNPDRASAPPCAGLAAFPKAFESDYEALFHLSLDLLCIASADGYFKRVNAAFEKILGYTVDELEARPFIEFVHPEDVEATAAELRRLSEGHCTIDFENRYLCKDGSVRWFRWKALPVNRGERIYATATDVTEQRRAETRFRKLLESAPDAMVIVDQQGKIVLVNVQAERLFGFSRQELLNQSIEILVPERFRGSHVHFRGGYGHRPEYRGMGSRPELAAVRKDGSEFPAEISLGPIETDEGTLVSCAIRDLTQRKQAEEALREQRAQLLAAQRIQQYILPHAPPVVPGFDIAAAMYPAEFTGGDSFDYLPLPGESLGVLVSDVAGHGFAPALLMALAHAHIRSFCESYGQVAEILTSANRSLARAIEQERFVTALFGRLDPARRTFEYVNAGHPAGYLLDASGKVKARLTSDCLPLGVLPEREYRMSGSLEIAPGDVLLLVTDGVLESENPHGQAFGEGRLLETIGRNRSLPAEQLVGRIFDEIQAHGGSRRQSDDVTLMVIKAEQSAAPRATPSVGPDRSC